MELLRIIGAARSPFLDTVFSLITKLGEEIIVILVLCAIFWCIDKKLAYCMGISYFLSGLLVQGLKINFRIDRPWILDKNFKPVESAIKNASGYSFPSGHTQSAGTLFGTLGFSLKNKWCKAVCFAIALLVGFSRMYLGVHTLLDVGVSLILSLLIALFCVMVFNKDEQKTSKNLIMLPLLLTLAAIGVCVMAFVIFSSGAIGESYVIDCLKSAGAGIGFAVGMYIEKKYIVFSVKSKNFLIHVLKYVLGIAGVLVIKEGLKLIIGTGPAVDLCRYMLLGLWMTAIYPLVIKKVFALKETAE